MAAGGGDLQRPFGAFLAFDVLEVEPGGGEGASFASGGGNSWVPLKWLMMASKDGAAMTSTSPAQAASAPHSTGQMMPLSRAAAVSAARRTPATPVSEPSSASSPSTV